MGVRGGGECMAGESTWLGACEIGGACMTRGMHSLGGGVHGWRGHEWLGPCIAMGVHGWRVCIAGHVWLEPHPLYSWELGSMHPTGMLACFLMYSVSLNL